MNRAQLQPGRSVTAVRDGHLEHATVVEAGVRHTEGVSHGNLAYVVVRYADGQTGRLHVRRVFPPLGGA